MTETLDRDSAIPLYRQLQDILYAKITSGEWAPNQRLPSENEMNRIYGLSRMTVRGVLNKLTSEGLLIRVPGKGTYVSPAKITAMSPAYRGVREQLEAQGYAISTTLVSTERISPPSAVRDALKLRDEDVYAIVRLRTADGAPISVHRSFVPAHLAPELDRHDVVNEQLCVVLKDNYGLPMTSVAEDLEAVAVDGADAKLLDLRRGAPALMLTDVISDPGGRPFEYSTVVFRGDTVRLKFDYVL
ncbi:GntR family transcriptional regulator [soil metagenome]